MFTITSGCNLNVSPLLEVDDDAILNSHFWGHTNFGVLPFEEEEEAINVPREFFFFFLCVCVYNIISFAAVDNWLQLGLTRFLHPLGSLGSWSPMSVRLALAPSLFCFLNY